MIQLVIGNSIVNDFMSSLSATFMGLLPLLTIIISVSMSFYIIKKIQDLFPS